jgi:hypothetical protein
MPINGARIKKAKAEMFLRTENHSDTCTGLLYDEFSLVFMQLIALDDLRDYLHGKKRKKTSIDYVANVQTQFSTYAKPYLDTNINEVFQFAEGQNPLHTFCLPGFDFEVTFGTDRLITVAGTMAVRLSVFFNRVALLSYRMVVNGKAVTKTDLLGTDDLITLITLAMQAEQWDVDGDMEFAKVSTDVSRVSISNLIINSAGEWCGDDQNDCTDSEELKNFEVVFARYKACALKMCLGNTSRWGDRKLAIDRFSEKRYVYVDVWESVSHQNGLFDNMDEMQRIAHIRSSHQSELMGLMCLYTGEWLYRSNEYFESICGVNIALDKDMLIHANANVCLYIGTYGVRGSDAPTDWQSILVERSSYHVSEPEFLLILEMSLTQRFLIDHSHNRLLGGALGDSSTSAPVRAIEAVSELNLETTRLLMELDAVRYSRFITHRVMTQKTRENLQIDEALASLESKMQSIDSAMRNIGDIKSLRNGTRLNTVLASIAIASLLQILFMETTVPVLESLHIESSGISVFLITITFFLIVFGAATLAIHLIKNRLSR